MAENKFQKMVLRALGTKPILFNPDLARMLGDIKAGLFFSQLLFWWKKGREPDWIYKTIKEIEEETSLTRREQDRAINICRSKGIIRVKLKGYPPKRHFQIDLDELTELIMSYEDTL